MRLDFSLKKHAPKDFIKNLKEEHMTDCNCTCSGVMLPNNDAITVELSKDS